jgi:alanyl-tRNA synthetase
MKAVLDHVGIAVKDLAAALAFYRDALGLEIEAPEEVASQRVRAHFLPVGDAKLVARRVSGLDKSALRGLSDSLRDRLQRGVVVLAAEHEGRVQLLVSVTKDLTDRVKAGQLVKELAPIVGGGGGGRPDLAQAGGKDPAKIDEALAAVRDWVARVAGG